jgi:hypothetical protein
MEKPEIEHIDVLKEEPDIEKTQELSSVRQHKSPEERKLLWKQDFSIVLALSGCFFFAYLDRGQVGNARIMGLEQDLHLTNSQFYNCLLMFCKPVHLLYYTTGQC